MASLEQIWRREVKAKGYRVPSLAAKILAGILTDDKRGTVILDVGGGTGMVGKELCKEGFETIDILDMSVEMLDIARQTHVYRNMHHMQIKGLNSTTLDADRYDAVLAIGALVMFVDCLLCSDIVELIRITKPGGIVMITVRTETLNSNKYRGKLVPLFDQLEADCVWKTLERSTIENYMYGVEGQLFIFQKKMK